MSGSAQEKPVIDSLSGLESESTPVSSSPDSALEVVPHSSVSSPRELELLADGYAERAYSFWAYFRSHLGFVLAMAALMAVVAGILVVTGSNVSVIVLVTVCEALFACIVLDAGFCAIVSSTSSWICSAIHPKMHGISLRFWTSRELWKALSPIARLPCRARRLLMSLPPALAT